MKKVLIAVDETKGSQAIISVLKNQVRAPREVVVVHVQRMLGPSLMSEMLGEAELATLRESLVGTEHQEALDAKSEKIMAYYRDELSKIGLMSIKPVIRSGNPTEEILKVAREEEAELILLGCNGKGILAKMISGCVTKEVEKRVGVPVLVAKPQGIGCGQRAKGCENLPSRVSETYIMEGNK